MVRATSADVRKSLRSTQQETKLLRWSTPYAKGYPLWLKLIGCTGYYKLIQETAEMIDGAPSSVLDLGTGTGLVAKTFAKMYPKADVVAVDLSYNILKAAEAEDSFQDRLKLIQTSALALPFDSETFEIVTSFGVLCHIVEPQMAIKEIGRVLCNGGKIILWTRGTGVISRFLKISFPMVSGGSKFVLYSQKELNNYFAEAGFEDIIVCNAAHGLLVTAIKAYAL